MPDTPEKPVRGFYREVPDLALHLQKHTAVAEKISDIVYGLTQMNVPEFREGAEKTQQLINSKKCLLWTVDDINKLDIPICAALLLPNPPHNEIIPAIVTNSRLQVWQHEILQWPMSITREVINAILELPSLYEAASNSQLMRLIEEDEFMSILNQGDPSRHEIVPASRLRQR